MHSERSSNQSFHSGNSRFIPPSRPPSEANRREQLASPRPFQQNGHEKEEESGETSQPAEDNEEQTVALDVIGKIMTSVLTGVSINNRKFCLRFIFQENKLTKARSSGS